MSLETERKKEERRRRKSYFSLIQVNSSTNIVLFLFPLLCSVVCGSFKLFIINYIFPGECHVIYCSFGNCFCQISTFSRAYVSFVYQRQRQIPLRTSHDLQAKNRSHFLVTSAISFFFLTKLVDEIPALLTIFCESNFFFLFFSFFLSTSDGRL